MRIKKSALLFILSLLVWSPIPWLYIARPAILAGQPLAVYAVFLFIGGLVLLGGALFQFIKKLVSINAARVYVVLFMLAFLGAYQLSPLAPNWNCYGKHLYVAVANAAGQNCTTVCTDNAKKPCSGWSSCWNKFASCDASGTDQDGRPCKGCCFACDVVCTPDPSSDQPPSITASVSCSQAGNNGWCIGTDTLNLTASDPQGYTLTISGDINGTPFTCPTGNTCAKTLPDGNGTINYTVTASQSGLTDSGATTWARDTVVPVVTPGIPSVTGSNGWFKTSPVAISVTGSDTLSGLASAQVSVNGGAWQSSTSLSANGVYTLNFRAIDNAGNVATTSRTVSIDTLAPTINYNVSGTTGSNGWYVSQAVISATASDATSGVNTLLISDNGGAGKASPVTLSDGVHNLTITATDKAGNSNSVSQTVFVDTQGPTISPSVSGTSGTNGWYISDVNVNAAASDSGSGVQGNVEVSQDNGATWGSLPLQLSEGTYSLTFRAYDNAGSLSTSTLSVRVDTTLPTFTTSTIGTTGNAGWYVSAATTTVTPSDALSGVDHVEYSTLKSVFDQNNTGWQTGTSILSNDGSSTIDIKVFDVAGNVASGSVPVKVDTVSPVITPSVSGTSGNSGWLISTSTASASVSDATSGVSGGVQVSLDGGTTWQSSPITLGDGVYTITFRAFDVAGNQGSASLSASIDTISPALSFVYKGTPGMNGWYISKVDVSPKASDTGSGVSTSSVRADGGAWSPIMTVTTDGIHTVDAQASDVAGNVKSITDNLHIDTVTPISVFDTNHKNNEVISGTTTLSGQSSDITSGLQSVEVSTDGGVTWKSANLSSGKWSYVWDTSKAPNETYTVLVRATDMAGNQEEPTTSLTLLVDNIPPGIKLIDWWWIWDSGEYKVFENTYPIGEIHAVISDPQNRWKPVRMSFDEKSGEIKWDRRFPDGVIAPSGSYIVTLVACDVYGNCASARGKILIPFLAPVPATATPSPTPSPTPEFTVTAMPTTSVQVRKTPTPIVESVAPTRKQPTVVGREGAAVPILAVSSFIALLWAVSSAALADPRPKAILRIVKTILQKRHF